MRTRLLLPILATALLVATVALPASAHHAVSHEDASPPCANVVDGSAVYDGQNITVTIDLAAPVCPTRIGYNAYWSNESASAFTAFPEPTVSLDGLTLTFRAAVLDPDEVYVYAETVKNGAQVDRAPDSGTVCASFEGLLCSVPAGTMR